jgi:glycosyltransferase involved in cell wall biosynthesis
MIRQSKPKILILPSWYPTPSDPLVGSFFQEQSKLLLNKYDVRILYINFQKRPAFKVSIKVIIELFRYFLSYLFCRDKKIVLPDNDIFKEPPLEYYEIKTFSIKQKLYNKVKVSIYLDKIQQMIKDGWCPDLIHAHSVFLGGIVAYNSKLKFHIPYAITEHQPLNIYLYPKSVHQYIRNSFLEADKVLSISYDKIRQLGLNNIDVEPNLIYNFVDDSIFNKTVNKYQPGSELKIISVGAASFIKDYLTLLKAIRIIKSKGIPFKLYLVGLKIWGELDTYDKIIDFIKSNYLENDVIIIDKIDRHNVPDILSENSIFILTSIAEGMPVSVLEAMAMGLIVIATRHGGTEDIITSSTGKIVNIKDFTSIANEIKDIYDGKKQYEPESIREHVLSICGKQAFSKKLFSYYDEIIFKNSLKKPEFHEFNT